MGRNKTSTFTCKRERFSATAAAQKWSFVKVICRQPYNIRGQFGLQYVALYSEHSDPQTTPLLSPPSSHLLTTSPSPSHPSHSHTPHGPSSTPSRTSRNKLPSLPSALYKKEETSSPTSAAQGNGGREKSDQLKLKPPRGPLKESNDEENGYFEFSGVEKQSRLLSNALKAPQGSKERNPILERIIAEREKHRQERSPASEQLHVYEKKRLLLKDLPKAEARGDFTASYGGGAQRSLEVSMAFRKISAHGKRHTLSV